MAEKRDLRLPNLSPRPPQNNPPKARPTRVIFPKKLCLASQKKFVQKQLTEPSLLVVLDAKFNLCTWQYIWYNKNFNSISSQTQTRTESSKYLEITNTSL